MKVWILLYLAALVTVCLGQQECVRGACYPPSGELKLGRETELKASSTCGLTGIEVFCTPLGQWKMKCCPCDSRNTAGRNAHTIHNVLGVAGPDRWWQSKKDVSPVTIELDLKQLFQLDTLLLHFKGPRPDALVIERSLDFGKSWTPAHYMATDCKSAFPNISTEPSYDLNTPYCHTLPSNTRNPFQDQRVFFHPLNQFSNVNLPGEHKIEKLLGYTGLRVKLSQFGAVPYTPGQHPSRFYALKEIKMTGSCFCHGHARRCLADPASNYLPSAQVNGVCECQHNTMGANCEHCADLYNDFPWKPAERDNTHTCKRCECNNHAERCYFDPELYERSGRKSGGVCEECRHNTAGVHCERCAPNYYRNPRSTMQSPDACLGCQCDSRGSDGCDEITGACQCKANVEGSRCDRCKPSHYDLRSSNPLGCVKCSCSAAGSLYGDCDAVTGQCACRPNVEGRSCDRCTEGYWNPSVGCQRCNCDVRNSANNACDQVTGQCVCRPGFGGRTCSGCPENTYGDKLTGCKPCLCDIEGTIPGGCDRRTGVCVCREGVVGNRCDMCSRGHCESFPHCPICPTCFFSLDLELQNLTLWLSRLPQTPPSTPDPTHTDTLRRITNAQQILRRITDSLLVQPDDVELYTRQYGILHSELLKLGNDLSQADYSPPDLERELRKLQDQLSDLHLVYETKNQAATHFKDSNIAGALATVKHAYNRSTDAMKLAEGSVVLLNKSMILRGDAIKDLNLSQPINVKNLQLLAEDLATQPDLTPAAVQVCGSKRVLPCTPQQCEGELCPAEGAPPCAQDEQCIGALPWSTKAVQNSAEVKKKLQQLNDKITQANAQIQQSKEQTSLVRLATDELSNQVKHTRDNISEELDDIKYFVQRLKDFLSDPSSDPTAVQRVCDSVLDVKMPETVEALKKKLKEIQDVAASLPDSSMVLKNAESQLEQARQLLKDAENARDTALGLQDHTNGVLKSLNESESTLKDMEDKLQRSLDLIDQAKQDIANVEEVLSPAENLVKKGSGLIGSLRPLLDSLGEDVSKGRMLAEEAGKQAEGAEQEANNAAQDLMLLQDQLSKLKENANTSNQNGATGKLLHSLQSEATALIQDTAGIMNLLNAKEASLQELSEELLMKSVQLNGLEERLRKVISQIRTKATNLATCSG